MLKLLVVGQTPPPYHGQATMIESLVSADFAGIDVTHVPMRFSHDIKSIGRFRLYKLFELTRIIIAIVPKIAIPPPKATIFDENLSLDGFEINSVLRA